MPINDLVSKCLGKAPKVKKARTKAKINFDKDLGFSFGKVDNTISILFSFDREKSSTKIPQSWVSSNEAPLGLLPSFNNSSTLISVIT